MNEFIENGYFCKNNFISKQNVEKLKAEIIKLMDNPKVVSYSDRNNNLRRMERFTFSSKIMSSLNNDIIKFLKANLGNDYLLFKDKVNFKPSGGEGFFAHYDGIFEFTTESGNKKKGWYEYTDQFINVLVALDDFTVENGALEIAPIHLGTFTELLSNTKNDGSPDLNSDVESSCEFEHILVDAGDICIFDNKSPHRSSANRSLSERGSIYFTYTLSSAGDLYNKYFEDKHSSKNLNKSLTGEQS
jgi:ectoine hydroxylase-related dioxygenase (phytanoyl-CoA dioxygenase family)